MRDAALNLSTRITFKHPGDREDAFFSLWRVKPIAIALSEALPGSVRARPEDRSLHGRAVILVS